MALELLGGRASRVRKHSPQTAGHRQNARQPPRPAVTHARRTSLIFKYKQRSRRTSVELILPRRRLAEWGRVDELVQGNLGSH